MIIQQIQAENVLKYAKLHLTNIPARGLIAISGANESGKTSIAEIICLALFSRTQSFEPREIAKSIKWGEFRSWLMLEFTGKEDQGYTIVHDFDGDGNHNVHLSRSTEPTPLAQGVEAVTRAVEQFGGVTYDRFVDVFYLSQGELATPQAQSAAVKSLTGVETLERIGTELAQDIHEAQAAISQLTAQVADAKGQLTELNVQEDTLAQLASQRQSQLESVEKNDAEIARCQSTAETLRTAAARLAERVDHVMRTGVETSFTQWQSQATRLGEALNALDKICRTPEVGTGTELTRELHVWRDGFESRLSEFVKVRELAVEYRARLARELGGPERPEASPADSGRSLPVRRDQLVAQRRTLERRRTRARVGFILTLLIALASWGFWGLLTFARGSRAATQLASWLATYVQVGNFAPEQVLLAVAIVLSVMSLFFLFRSLAAGSRVTEVRKDLAELEEHIETTQREAHLLARHDTQSLPSEVEALRQLQDERLAAAVSAFANGPGAPFLDTVALSMYLEKLATARTACESRVRDIRERFESQAEEAKARIDTHRQELSRLDQENAHEQARHQQAAELQQRVSVLQGNIDEQQRRIEVRQVAKNLLQGTGKRLSLRFNLEMRRVLSQIVPLLTEGHYQTVQVDDNFEIQVFSSEKGNFLSLDEISGGTYRQLLLAIRLALAQALITAVVRSEHFIVLDEPFAFFDEPRLLKALELLPRVSTHIAQVWVIAHQFDNSVPFDLHLRCTRESDTLIASGSQEIAAG